MKKVALVTGASSGIGKSTAEELCKTVLPFTPLQEGLTE